jgi:hypothetical protein
LALGAGDVVVELALDGRVKLVQARQHGVAVLLGLDDDAQRAQVEHALEAQALALHLFPDAVEVLGPALHLGVQTQALQLGQQRGACLVHAQFTLQALLVQRAGQRVVGLGFEEAEGQVFQLPLDLPDAQPVGQRGEHLARLQRHLGGHRLLAGGEPAQGLQARGQAQQHHAQVAAEGQQHLAHALDLLALLGRLLELRAARGALHAHQLARVLDQLRVAFTEALGDQLLGLREVLAGVHQVGSGLDGGRGADAGQDGRHAVGMRQGVLAGVEALAAQQRFRERARTIEHVERLRRPRRGSGQRARQIAFEQLDDGSALGFGGGGFQVRGWEFFGQA